MRETKRKQKLKAADLFCGAGGTSEALRQICEANKQQFDLVAVNHWPIAIDTHSANHAYAKHMCAKLEAVNPHELVPGGRLNLLIAGIECTHHSNARGGRPRNDQSRSSAWLILKWCSELYIETVIIENVKEFRSWGPLGVDAQPLKSKRGDLFLQFLESMRKLGYNVEHRVLCAADYGDPTTRERLFIVSKRGRNRAITWAEPTHAPASHLKRKNGNLFTEKLQPWRVAREIIDWGNKGRSIFGRTKPLAAKTLERIAAGLRKQGPAAEPFLVMLYGTNKTRSIDKPVPTVTANGNHIGLVQPFIMSAGGPEVGPQSIDNPLNTVLCRDHMALVEPFLLHYRGKSKTRDIDEPTPTITTVDHVGLVQPFMIGQQSGAYARSVEEPVPTVATAGAISLIEPFMVQVDQQGSHGGCTRPIDQPVGTIITKQNVAVVEPFIVPQFGEREGQEPRTHSVDAPVPTVTGHGAGALVEPFIMAVNHGDKGSASPSARSTSLDEPMPTVTAQRSHGVVEPFIVKYYRTGKDRSVDEPLDTITTTERFGLITTEHGTFKLDILFRMLTNKELARAQGLTDAYKFTGKGKDVTRQIGNMVPIGLAKAVIGAQIPN